MAVGTGIGGAVLMIVAEKMALKALGQRTSGSQLKGIGAREDSSRRGEHASAIGELDMLGRMMRNGESMVGFVYVTVIRSGGVYCGGRRESH